eukprot:scaffold22454_cov146-Skeletonema_marinoi.AAC.6
MAKTKSNHNKHRKKDAGNWSNADHEHRMATRIASLQKKRERKQRALLEQEEQNEEQLQPLDDDKPPAAKKPKHEQPLHQKRSKNYRNKHARLAQHVPEHTYKHTHLAHDGYEQIESSKLRLATSQIQRQVTALKERLEEWDPVEEAKLAEAAAEGAVDETSMEHKLKLHAEHRKEDAMARAKAQSEVVLLHAKHGVNSSFHRRKHNLKKHERPGPETWKLKGAARPAWEVYDFDTRYQDPHVKAHEDANARARRVKNIIRLCKGRFALDNDEMDEDSDSSDGDNNNNSKKLFPTPQPYCRKYLSLLTQLGSLQLERKNYSSARKAFLEVLELEGTNWPYSITNARNQLMNMYMSTNRPASARKLWERLDIDGSAWIRYSAALIEYVSWNLLQEEGSTAESAERLLAKAIRGNVYVAFFLGWPQMFEKAMEYTEELVERGDSPSGSILEAIEYGCCVNDDKGLGMWGGTDGSLEWVRSVILKVLNTSDDEGSDANAEDKLVKADLMSWESKLAKEEEEYERERNEKEDMKANEEVIESDNEESSNHEEEDEEEPDSLMYAGMFRTAMDWLQDAGEFLQAPSYDFISTEDNTDEKDEVDDMTANQTANEDGLDDGDDSGSGTDDSSESEE